MVEVIKFGAEWCNTCRNLKKILEEREDKYKSIDVDTPQGKEMSKKYGIRSIPTTLFVKDGEIIMTVNGVFGLDKFDLIYDKLVQEDATE